MDPFVCEIRIVPFNFTPTGWAWCDGQLMPISQNTAVFSLVGTMYGGDGKSTFALPDLQGRMPMFWGQGPGLSLYDQGQTGGSETVALLESEIPSHSHVLRGSNTGGETQVPAPSEVLASSLGGNVFSTAAPTTDATKAMNGNALAPAGGDQPHNNMSPYLTMYFVIALQGVYPPRA